MASDRVAVRTCRNGHAVTVGGEYVRKNGERECLKCRAATGAKWRAGLGIRSVPPTSAERFWSFVQKTDSCWLWTGAVKSDGYGKFWDGRRNIGAHRFCYELSHGAIPAGMQTDHLCKVRNCVNPDHLEIVTPRENTARSASLIAENMRKTDCKRGHPLSGDNLLITNRGFRQCRICKRWRDANRKRFRLVVPDPWREK